MSGWRRRQRRPATSCGAQIPIPLKKPASPPKKLAGPRHPPPKVEPLMWIFSRQQHNSDKKAGTYKSPPRFSHHSVSLVSNMKYLATLSAILLVALSNFAAEARIGSDTILAHSEAVEEIVDIVRDRSQLAHRELKVCRRVSDDV